MGAHPGERRVSVTPAQLCGALLDALDASEGRRRRRSRNTTADSIGLDIQRAILAAAVRDAPAPADFERWLLERCFAEGASDGAHRAMALSIWHEWEMASNAGTMSTWLTAGARSDDREGVADAT